MSRLIVANIKMNINSPKEAEKYLREFQAAAKGKKLSNTLIVICLPFIYLEKFSQFFKGNKKIKIGAQDIFWEKQGAYTGEVSAAMVKNIGADYSIIGHSERRKYFSESDETSNLKIKAALKERITPIYCVGESREERRMNLTKQVIIRQLQSGLKDISRSNLENLVICYEPVWAISSNNPSSLPTTDEVMEARLLIRKILTEKYGSKTALKPKIIYGGSVNCEIAENTCVDSGMEGALVGRESLTPCEFIKIASMINC